MVHIWHGIVVDVAFHDKELVKHFKVLGKKRAGPWIIFRIAIPEDSVENYVKTIQKNMKVGFYSHLYSRDGSLIVIFQRKIFRIKSDKSTWTPAVDYGKSIGIPESQLDFYPCRFEDETY